MNELKHFSQFRSLLQNYQPSESAKETLKHLRFVALVAPTSAGRNTIIRSLEKTGKYYFIVSDTTRSPRVNDGKLEQDGSVYWFRSEEDILNDLKQGKFLEAEIIHNQQVSGVSIRELQKARQENKIAITDMDIGGIHNVMKAKADTIAILVLPPSFKEWQRRIAERGKMTDEELVRRLQTAERIFTTALGSKELIFVINNDLSKASKQIEEMVDSGQIDTSGQSQARALVAELKRDTQQFLSLKS
jgi:guanylate kinase